MKSFVKALLTLAALALFSWYLSKLGLARVWELIKSLGAFAPLVLLPYFVVYLVDCLAWSQTLPAHKPPFLTRLRIRWAGESVNNLIPTAYVGGEAAKVLLLRRYRISPQDATVAAVVSKTAQSVAQLLFILAASAFFFHLTKNDSNLRLAILFILIGGISAVALLLWAQKVGFFKIFLKLASALPFPLPHFDHHKARLLELDRTIFGFYRNEKSRFFRSTFFYLCGWTLDTVEIYLVAHLLGVPITWPQALVMEAFTGVAKALGMWLPGSLGVQESGIVLIGKLVGLPDPFVAAYAIIRRARELIFAAIGMLLFYSGKTAVPNESIPLAAAAPRD